MQKTQKSANTETRECSWYVHSDQSGYALHTKGFDGLTLAAELVASILLDAVQDMNWKMPIGDIVGSKTMSERDAVVRTLLLYTLADAHAAIADGLFHDDEVGMRDALLDALARRVAIATNLGDADGSVIAFDLTINGAHVRVTKGRR